MGFFDLAYRVGFTPWERAGENFPVELDDYLARTGLAPGRALDMGCGTGDHAIALAARGWRVIGVDYVARAVLRARKKARAAGLQMRFVVGDVVELCEVFEDNGVGMGEPFGLVLDFGCFHGLNDPERRAYARELSCLVEPGSRLLMLAFTPGRRGQLLRGADWERMRGDFAGWELESERRMEAFGGRLAEAAELHWIELVRTGLRATR
ncbi:class I SAM-dependent methyltransferase [Tomitella biformata]|uniref:class I SAM-dependent methyltransferase n=1 Tax=Tomitella biformata TaxID=630403 RepID=UPI00046400F9|nr:class I SAM-dependent methyltransferase [Tomitella biformata]